MRVITSYRIVLIGLLFLFAFPNVAEESNRYSIKAPLAVKSLLLDIIKVNNKLIALGERGHILVSKDNAKSWNQQTVPTQSTLTSTFFLNENIGWVVGHDAVILKTIDGGETWNKIYSAPEEQLPLLDVWFKNENNGIAIGAYGYYLETTDGGDSWQSRYISEDDFHLNSLDISHDGCLYIAAESGNAYRSVDDGKTWEALVLPYTGSFFSIKANDCNTAYIAGLRGNLYKTSNAGRSWQRIHLDTDVMLTDIILNQDNRLVLTGLDGLLLIEKNDEEFQRIDTGNRYAYVSILEIDPKRFVFTSEQGVTVYSLAE